MLKPSPAVPMEFLLTASRNSLQDFELSRLNHAAMLAKRLRETLHEMAEESALAIVARILIENESLRGIGFDQRQESFNFTDVKVGKSVGGVVPAEPKQRCRNAANVA